MIAYTKKDEIFHYTKLQTAIEKILPTLSLKFSEFSKSHDPIEYKDYEKGPKYNIIRYDDKRRARIQSKILKCKFEHYKVLCFCRNPQSKKSNRFGWRKARMWAQYAEDNTGVCFVFSKYKLIDQLKKTFNKRNISYRNVGYDNFCISKFKKYQLIDEGKFSILSDKEYLDYHLKKHKKELFFLKDHDFKDENEFRIILKDKSEEEKFLNILGSLKGIILGDKQPKVYIDLFQNIIQRIENEQENKYWDDKLKIALDRMHFYEGLPTIQHIK